MQGANRTGRPFTGDYAGDLLYATLLEFGFAKGVYQARPDDGLKLVDCRISQRGALRAAAEQAAAGRDQHLPAVSGRRRIAAMPKLRAIVALGRIAHEIDAEGARRFAPPPRRSRTAPCIDAGALRLYDSYHCSRYNTNTRVLTPEMFRSVFAKVRKDLDRQLI